MDAAPAGPAGHTPGGPPPWEVGGPQPALRDVALAGGLHGTVLDVGCGTGEHALLAAGLGLAAVGVDRDPVALERAREEAARRGLDAGFVVGDALDLAALPGLLAPDGGPGTDTVVDSLLFHGLAEPDRVRYAEQVRRVLRPAGRPPAAAGVQGGAARRAARARAGRRPRGPRLRLADHRHRRGAREHPPPPRRRRRLATTAAARRCGARPPPSCSRGRRARRCCRSPRTPCSSTSSPAPLDALDRLCGGLSERLAVVGRRDGLALTWQPG